MDTHPTRNQTLMMWSPRTLSFWLSALGTSCVLSKRTRTTGAVLLMAVGFGGTGGVYFRVAERHHVPAQPACVWPHMTRDDWKSIIEHAAFLIPALIALKHS